MAITCSISSSEITNFLSGFTRSMKSEVVSPLRKSSDFKQLIKKSLFVITPPMCADSRALANLLAASVLFDAYEIIFASIGSKSVPTIVPEVTPESHLASTESSFSKAINVPISGRKSLFGFSAYSRASIDDPFQVISF